MASYEKKIQFRAWGPDLRDDNDDPDGRNFADVEVEGDHKVAVFQTPIEWRSLQHPFENRVSTMRGAKLFLFGDGTCHWRVDKISSRTDGNDWGAKFFFGDRNNTLLVEWPKIWSGTLTADGRRWDRLDLAVPQAHFPFITRVTLESYV